MTREPKCTAYATSRGYPVDDERHLDRHGFARSLQYEPRSEVHMRPPSTAISRATVRDDTHPRAAGYAPMYAT